jgi:hypothetical protein
MFQITMSHIHDEARSERFDTDSCVSGIEDGLIALQAFQAYIAELRNSYGITFELGDSTDRVPLRASARMEKNSIHGPATIYVELQRPEPHTDVERIVELMRVKARYTLMQHPA